MSVMELPKSRGDFEQDFVSYLTNSEALSYFIRESVHPKLLTGNKARAIYDFAVKYREDSQDTPSLEVLQTEFPKFEFVEPNGSPQWIVEKLREQFNRGFTQTLTRDLSHLATKDPEKAIQFIRTKVFEQEQIAGSQSYVYTGDYFGTYMDMYNDKQENGYFRGFSLGWDEIDKFTGGLRAGHLAFLLARPKRFKTWMILNAFLAQARQGEVPGLWTLELTVEEIMARIGCMISGFSFNQWHLGLAEYEDKQRVIDAFEEFNSKYNFYILRPPPEERTVPHLLADVRKHGITSMLIDQLSFLEPKKDWYSRPDLATADIVYDLKKAATKQGEEIPIYCAAQLNRQAEDPRKKKDDDADKESDSILASTAALTGAIEQVADHLYGLKRTKEMWESGYVRFEVVESRHHDLGRWHIGVDLKQQTSFDIGERGHFPVELTPEPGLLS